MSNNISDKFKKELVNFFKWVEDSNYTVSKNGEDQEWSLSLCPDYIEPGRYKLIVFIERRFIGFCFDFGIKISLKKTLCLK